MAALQYLDSLRTAHPELSEWYTSLADLYQRKLWHQLTQKLEQFVVLAAGDALIQLYHNFITDFETKINLLKLAQFAVIVSKQYAEKEAAVSYLEGVIEKIKATKDMRYEEPVLYIKLQIAVLNLEQGNQKECNNLLEEGKTTLDSMTDIDPSVYASFYWVSSQYHKSRQEFGEFYKSALLYLAYSSVESLSESFKLDLAFDLSLSALLGDNIYNFGELLAHPIIQSLLGTKVEWLYYILQAFNSGDLVRYQELCSVHGAALWCLLMGDINMGRDSQMPKKTGNGESCEVDGNGNGEGWSSEGIAGKMDGNSEVGIPPGLCKFHGGWGFGDGKSPGVAGMGSKVQCLKRFDIPPPLKEMLNKSVSHTNSRNLNGGTMADECGEERSKVLSSGLKLDVAISMLNKLHEMKLDEKRDNNADIQKEEMIANLMQQIKELEKQVKERREWAREKAMQAARRLSSDLTELKILRMEREEETQRLKKGKQSVEDPTKKRFAEMESALRKASGQVDRANAAVRRLENENAEMRAEMEAAKLSASENVKTCLEIAKREKKSVKRLLALEKQKAKLQEEIATEKKRIADLRQEIIQVEQTQKITEAKWKQEIEAKDQAAAHLEELRRTKETIEAENKRRHEALRLKIELDFQRHKDDLQRLEQELARLKLSANPASSPSTKNSERNSPQEDTIARMLSELDLMDDSSETEEYVNRECILCMKDEVSVVFLPCAHQVICASCNETYGKNGKPTCPCCRTPIQQRICVFGASS